MQIGRAHDPVEAFKALSGERSPDFGTILKVIDALGLSLHAKVAPG